MDSKPTISVVIPCYNAAPFLRETLESVFVQTYPPLEIIVVDDGSTDESAVIAESFGSPVRVIRQENQGESVARNRGIEEAGGDWVAFLDADDLWLPNKLERQIQVLRDAPESMAIHTGCCRFFPDGTEAPYPFSIPDVSDRFTLLNYLLHHSLCISTAMVRRTVSVRFPEWTQYSEEMIFYAELSLEGQLNWTSESLSRIRDHEAQQSKWANHWQSRGLTSDQQNRYAHEICANFKGLMQWVDDNSRRIGHDIADNLSAELRNDLVRAALTAKGLRNWEMYWVIREMANSLEWVGQKPKAIREQVLPRWVYSLKDKITGGRVRTT